MWNSMVIAIAAVAACGGPARSAPSPADSVHTRCVDDALRQVPPQQTVMLICRDGSRAKGEVLEFDASRGLIRLLPDGAPRRGHTDAWFTPADPRHAPRAVPAADVMRLEWREPGGSGTVGAIAGLLIGCLLGGLIGYSTAPESHDFLDFTELEHAIAGTAIGGALGLSLGVVMASSRDRTHTIDCWSDPEVVRKY